MASASIHLLGKPIDDEMTGESCRFKVMSSAVKRGDWIIFPAFITGEHFWRLQCFPSKGNVKGEIDNLLFVLYYGDEWKDVKATVEFGVIKKDQVLSSIKWRTVTHTFPRCGECVHFEKLVQGDELKRYLKDDCFIVICNITILSADVMGTSDSGIIFLSSLNGTSRNHSIEEPSLKNKDIKSESLINSGKEIKKDMASGLVQFKVPCSHVTANAEEYLAFPTFMVGEHCWVIKCYYKKDSHLSFFIVVRSATKDLKANIEFGVLKEGEGSSVKWITSVFTFENCPSLVRFEELVKRDDVKRYLQDNYFRVICNITILSETITFDHDVTILGSTGKPTRPPTHGPSPYLQDHLKKLLQNKEKSDVTFEVNGEIFQAHKLVLGARSSVFNAKLQEPPNENYTENIKISEMEPGVFKAMLHFIYTDMLPDLNESIYGVNEITNLVSPIQMLQHLLAAADLYALERLKSICEDKLSKSITIDTVLTFLVLAEKHHCPNLKAICLEYVTLPQNFGRLAVTNEYAHLGVSYPNILMELGAKLSNMSI